MHRAKAGAPETSTDADLPRQMLHAARIAFTHPLDGTALEFRAPLPEDFQAAARRFGLWADD